jgi:hypothetical protein
MGFTRLPDIPESDWMEYQRQRFVEATQPKFDSVAFLEHANRRIAALDDDLQQSAEAFRSYTDRRIAEATALDRDSFEPAGGGSGVLPSDPAAQRRAWAGTSSSADPRAQMVQGAPWQQAAQRTDEMIGGTENRPDWLQGPQQALYRGVEAGMQGEDPMAAAGRGLRTTVSEPHVNAADLYERAGYGEGPTLGRLGDDDITLRDVVGGITDVVADPLNIPAGAVLKPARALQAGARVAAPLAEKGLQAGGRLAREVAESAPDVARRLATEQAGELRVPFIGTGQRKGNLNSPVYYHVVGENWNSGEPLLSLAEYERRYGEPPRLKWDVSAEEYADADVVSLHDNLPEAEAFQREHGGRILQVESPPDEPLTLMRNGEGYPVSPYPIEPWRLKELGSSVPGGLTAGIPQQPGESDEDYQRRVQAGYALAAGGMALGGVRNLAKAKALPKSTNAATQKLFDMYYGDGVKSVGRSAGEKLADLRDWAIKHFTDQNVEVSRFQQMAEKAKGARLTADEMADVLMRLNPDKAAEVHLQEGLKPAIQGAGDDVPWLSAYLTHKNNVDVAEATGQKVQQAILDRDIPPSLAARNLNVERGTLRLQEYRKTVMEAKDAKALAEYDRLNDVYSQSQDKLAQLDEQLFTKMQELDFLREPSGIVQPPRGLFVGWSEKDIIAFAEREGRNPYQPDWWDKMDPVALKDARSSLTRGGGKTASIKSLQSEIKQLKTDRAAVLGEGRLLERDMERVLGGIDPEAGNRLKADIAERQKRIAELDKKAFEKREAALGRQRREATTKGADAEANRAFSGGLRVADSRTALDAMPGELGAERFANVEQQATKVYELVGRMRQRLVESGVWSQEFADEMAQRYPHYVPTKILDYMAEPQAGMGAGKSLSLRDRGLRELTIEGTEKAREDPLASVVRLVYQTEAMARKNDVFNSFVKLRDHLAASDPSWAERIREVPSDYVTKKSGADAEHIITGYVGGKKVNYVVPKELGLAYEAKPAQIPGLSTAMQLFKMGATSRNPLFLASNALMDAMTFIARESVRGGGPQTLPRVVKALGEAYVDAFKGLPVGEYRGATADYLKGGGGMFGYFQVKPDETAKAVRYMQQTNALDIKSKEDALHLIKQLVTLQPVETLGERIELAPRVASYNLARKRGLGVQQAVINGRSVTMDFAQGGTISKFIDQFIPFFNVGTQSGAQVVRAWKENPRGFVATAATLLAAPTVAVEAWNRADAQRARDYDDVPQYIKDQGIVIMLPVPAPTDDQGNRRPQFILLRTREYTPFVTLTREVTRQVMGDEPRHWADLLGRGVLASVSPVSGTSATEVASGLQMPGLGTFTQLQADKDLYRNRTIATKYNDENASAFSKAVAERLGVRPSQVEFAIRDLGSGVAGMGLAASDIAAGEAKTTGTPQGLPGVGGFIGRFVRGNTGDRLDKAQAQTMSDRTKKFLSDNGVALTIGTVGREIANVPLTMDEQSTYQEKANQYIDEALAMLAQHPDWPKVPEKNRERAIRDYVAKAREKAAKEVMQVIGETEARRRLAAGTAGVPTTQPVRP